MIKKTAVSLDADIALQARIKAAELDMSRSKLINYLLELYLKSEELQAEVRKSLAK